MRLVPLLSLLDHDARDSENKQTNIFVLELNLVWVDELSVEVRMLLKRDQDQKMQIATSCECAEHSEREHIRWLDKKR